MEIGCAASLCWFLIPGNGKRAIQCANSGDVKGLSKAINGGWNGLDDRIKKTNLILQAAAQ
jgi:predicted chitinase